MTDPVKTLGRTVHTEQAVEVLRADGVVLLPLDTIYALAADATSEPARRRLLQASGTPDHATLAWHAGSASVLRAALDAAGVRLADRAWEVVDALLPGPVTLAIELPGGVTGRLLEALGVPEGLMNHEGRLMVRVPDHPVCRAILERIDEPVVMAAPPGETPTKTLEDAALSIHAGGQPTAVDAVCDAAPQPVGRLSTHVDVGLAGAWRVAREGPVSADEIARRVGRLILFVCTGNTCRSPMAMAIARRLIHERALPGIGRVDVRSAGVYAAAGAPATTEAANAAAQRNADLSQHRSQPLDTNLARSADAVFVMTNSHLQALEQEVPDLGAVARLLDPQGADVPDPIGGPQDLYDQTAIRIETLIERRLVDAGIIGEAPSHLRSDQNRDDADANDNDNDNDNDKGDAES